MAKNLNYVQLTGDSGSSTSKKKTTTSTKDTIYGFGGSSNTEPKLANPDAPVPGSHFDPSKYTQGHIEDDLTVKTYNTPASEASYTTQAVTTPAVTTPAYDPTQDLLNAYNARQQAMEDNYQAALDQLRNSYNASVNDLRSQGDDALRQAYINMMMNKRGLNQQLEAAGLTGGATESAMANLYNTYANDRNEIARALNQRLTQVGNNYGNNVSNLGMNYNTNFADAIADYQNQLIAAKQSMANSLAKTTANSTGYRRKAYVPTEEETLVTETPVAKAVRTMAGMSPMQAYNYISGTDLPNEEKAEAYQLAGFSLDELRQLLAAQNATSGSTTGATSGASLGGATNGAVSGAATGALGGVNNAATNAAVQGALTGLAGILGLNR